MYVRFGWLPDGLRDLQYQAGLLLSGPGVHLGASTGPGGGPWRGVAVRLFPRGVQPSAPQRDSGEPAQPSGTTPGPKLNGGASSFASYSGFEQPEAILRWRYAPDGWAEVRVVDTAGDVRRAAAQVARSLRFGDGPVPMPATVRGVPTTLRVIAVDVQESLDEPRIWYASTTWSPEPITGDPGQQRARTMTVSVSRHENITDPADNRFVDPNTTVDGHPARFGGKDGIESVTVYDVDGADVSIDDSALLPAGGTRALFKQIALVPEPAAWHTHLRS